jgi:hypothetical protein
MPAQEIRSDFIQFLIITLNAFDDPSFGLQEKIKAITIRATIFS